MAKVKQLFVGFVTEHKRFWEERFGYVMKGERPGQKAKIYCIFRDQILVPALNERLAELASDIGIDAESVPSVAYILKKSVREDGNSSPRALLGWVMV